MAKRTPEQVGEVIRRRRLAKQLKQDEVPGVSSATIRKLEKGLEPNPTQRIRTNLAQGLGWPDDAFERLVAGDDPASFVADTMDLGDRVARLSPEDRKTVEDLIDSFERRMGDR